MKKVLIVEDDVFVSRMYARAFKIGGYDVESVPDGEAALVFFEKNEPPSAILLDIKMPKMGGIELLKLIRKDKRLDKVAVAILTNSYFQETSDECIALGADLYMVKIEHSSKDIVATIDKLIEKKASTVSKS
jgi:CheY-like chemotaxis protein